VKILGGLKSRAYAPYLYFTRNAATGTSPLITAATAVDADFIWYGPGGTRFTGKQPNIANFPAGDFRLTTTKWDAITALAFNDRKLTKFDPSRVLSRMTALTTLDVFTNASLTGDISGWMALMPAIVTFRVYTTGLSGDIGSWTLPASLVNLHLQSTSVSGDIGSWTLPASLVNLYLFFTSVSGDIGSWTLPASLVTLYLAGTSVSGDIGSWTLPASLANLYLAATSVSGDIGSWTLPASLANLHLFSTSVDYGTGNALDSATRNTSTYRLESCAMTAAEVDRILADCVDSGTTSSTLNVAGTNAAPTGGAANADLVQLRLAIGSGGLGWTVTVTA